jgi:hypothetical protein
MGLIALAVPAGASPPPPSLLLNREGPLEPGTEVVVSGFGWPASQLVVVETCGNAGLGGSSHCDHTAARSVPSSPTGEIAARITIGAPPSPCPCLLHAYIVGTSTFTKTPVVLAGHPEAPPEPVPDPTATRRLEMVSAELREVDPWLAWFGGPPRRELVLEIRNTTAHPIAHATLDVAWGKQVEPTGYVDAPAITDVAPGETVRVVVPVELDPLAWGSYSVNGQVVGHVGTSFELETRSMPYGLLALPALLLALVVLVKSRNGLARVLARRLVVEPATPPDGRHLAGSEGDGSAHSGDGDPAHAPESGAAPKHIRAEPPSEPPGLAPPTPEEQEPACVGG